MLGQVLAGILAVVLILWGGAGITKAGTRKTWTEALGEAVLVFGAIFVYIGGLLGLAMLIGYAFTGEFYNAG